MKRIGTHTTMATKEPSTKFKAPAQTPNTPIKTTGDSFVTAKENSIEVYDDKFGRNSILTRSARMRKFKFYQYKPVYDSPSSTSSSSTPSTIVAKCTADRFDVANSTPSSGLRFKQTSTSFNTSPPIPESPVLLPRDDILQGKVPLVPVSQQSKELCEVDNQIAELEKKIAELNSNNSHNNLDEIFDLVNRKNDLIRRQMQLNILEQEKVLEKANEELTKELRSLMSIEDSKKTKAMLERQQYLYDQSLALVNRRNELVLHMDVQEKGIDEDNALKEQLKSVISQRGDFGNRRSSSSNDQSCCIQ